MLALGCLAITIGGSNPTTENRRGLFPEWGISFKQIGYIYPNVEKHFVTIDLEVPKRRDMNWKFDVSLKCSSAKNPVIGELCHNAAKTILMVKRGALRKVGLIDSKFRNLNKLLPIAKKSRNKRFIFPIISLFTGAVGFVSQYHMYKKIGALQESVAVLRKNDFVLDKKITTLYKNQVTIVQKTAEKFRMVESQIERQNLYIHNVTHTLASAIVQLEDNLGQIAMYSSQIMSSVDQFTYRTGMYFQSAEAILDAYYNGILDLMTGRLPRDLINPMELTNILESAAMSLQMSLPDYELLHQTLPHYYTKTDLIYDIVDAHLVVTIPIMIKKKNQKLLPLYQIQTCHVPYVVGDDKAETVGSYTRLKLEKEYIAILENNFVEFSTVQMDSCSNHDQIWTCDTILLQTHHSKVSCLAAIYWNYESDQIKELCQFDYFHKINPQPVVLESDNNILMANLDTPWSFDCQNRNVPLRVKGSRYAILTRDSICGCSILGTSFYIEEKVCQQSLNKIELRYPLNAAVMSYYMGVLKENAITNMSGLFPTPPEIKIPKLNLSVNDADNVLVKTDEAKPIPLARVSSLLKKKEKLFYDADEKQINNSKFENWWSGENIAIGCAFVLAAIGSLAAIIAIFNCVRTHRVSSTMGAMMLHQMPKAHALPMFCKRDASITEILPPLMVQLTISLSIFLAAKLLWKVYCHWSVVKIMNPNVVSNKTRNQVHLSLEIFNRVDYVRVYLFSVKVNPMFISMHGSILQTTLKLELKRLYCYLELDWVNSDMVIKQEGQTIILPKIAYLPIYKYWAMKKILARNHGIRLIMTSDGMTYVQSERLIGRLEIDDLDNPEYM